MKHRYRNAEIVVVPTNIIGMWQGVAHIALPEKQTGWIRSKELTTRGHWNKEDAINDAMRIVDEILDEGRNNRGIDFGGEMGRG